MVRSDALFRRESVRVREKTKAKNPAPYGTGFFLFNARQFPTLTWETPHYHRRYGVSLLSSAWGQVGPPR